MTSPSTSPCAYLRELIRLLTDGASGPGDGNLVLGLFMLEMRAETCGAPEPTLRAITTARLATEFAMRRGLPGLVAAV
jgi:hypothetical protein